MNMCMQCLSLHRMQNYVSSVSMQEEGEGSTLGQLQTGRLAHLALDMQDL